MSDVIVPGARAALVEGSVASRSYYTFFNAISANLKALSVALNDVTAQIPGASPFSPNANVVGGYSIITQGTLKTGIVRVLLEGDVDQAPALSFYGALDTGGKGWWNFSANFQKSTLLGADSLDLADLADSGTGSLLATTFDAKGRKTGSRDATLTGTADRITVAHGDASDGLPTIDLATVEDAGGGALLRFVRDAWGRITGTSAANTSDLTEGSNLYYTDARADGRIAVQKGQPDGLASLDGDGKLDAGQLPALAITETFVVDDEAAMLALTAEQGDVAVRKDLSKSFILAAEPASTLSNWQDLLTPASPVTSVFGRVGSVTAASGDYTFAQIAAKPTTLAGYGITDAQAFITAGTTAQYWRGDKTWQTLNRAAVGLGNVDNTADTAKPVSAAQAAADALRVLKAGDTMTGPLVLPSDPALPLQAAPKQYVDNAVAHIAPHPVTVTAEPFMTGDGTTSSAELTIAGLPLDGAPTVSAIHRTDWQGRQLLYATARTNLAFSSEDFTSSAFSKSVSGTGTLTLTKNYAESPRGDVTATRLQFDIAAGTSAADLANIYQAAAAVPASTLCTSQLWLRTNDGSTAQLSFVGPDTVIQLISVGPLWTQFSASGISIGGWTMRLRLRGNEGTSKSADILSWGLQCVTGGAVLPYISNPSLSEARTVTDYTLSGADVSFGEVPLDGALLDWDGTGTPKYPASFAGPVKIGQYTLGTLPDASTYDGSLIRVTDATGGPALCLSDGTDWINVNTNAAVS